MKLQNTREDFSKPIELSGNATPVNSHKVINNTSQVDIFEIALDYLFKILMQWKWIALSVIISLSIAYVYLRYKTTTIYYASSTLILNDGNSKGNSGNQINIFSGMDMLGNNDIDNEIAILKSTKTVKRIIEELNLSISYIVKGRVLSYDMYSDSPLKVEMESENINKISTPIELTAKVNSDKSVSITKKQDDKTSTIIYKYLPAYYSTPYGDLKIQFRDGEGKNVGFFDPFVIYIQNPMSIVYQFRGSLNVSPTSEKSSMLRLSISTLEQQKGVDFLNTIVSVYNKQALEDKNREAMESKIFIDERLALIDNELEIAEKKVENYKKEHKLTDLDTDTRISLQKNNFYEDKLLNLETTLNLVNYLEKYINNSENINKIIPSNIGIDDIALETSISEHNKCLIDRERFLRSNKESNPLIKKLDEQIKTLRIAINNAIDNVKEKLNISRNEANKQYQHYSNKIQDAPSQERHYSGMLRNQQIKASLFLMLLQKREETALQLAMTANSAKAVEEAVSSGPVSTNRSRVNLIAFLAGLFLPIFIIILFELLYFKIRNSKDVRRLSSFPILGEIPISDSGIISIHRNENKITDETFRNLRTNLMFLLGQGQKVILITSSLTGEGKTFITVNSALSTSLLKNKKVLIIELDFRNPKLVNYLGINSKIGISDYLSEEVSDLNSLILQSGISPNLYLLPTGTIPQNPTELLVESKLDYVIEEMKKSFDYIFIDTTSVNTVSDTIVSARLADLTVYVCRAKVTNKNSLKVVDDFVSNQKLKNPTIVINAVNVIDADNNFVYGKGKVNKNGKWSKIFKF